jgi:hypothetical protein
MIIDIQAHEEKSKLAAERVINYADGLEKAFSNRIDEATRDVRRRTEREIRTAMAVERVPGGYRTREGNTSRGTSGSQSNGGGVHNRFRPDSSIVYIVRPDWESAS